MERAFLVVPRSKRGQLEEALKLAETAGYNVVRVWKSRYERRLGRGLIEEISLKAEEEDPSTIIVYGEPQPSALFALMKATRRRVIDRVELILEIFVRHAGSREAKLQIEMARIKHEIPLIREMIRRSKMGELPGFLGPGGYAIDAYYRHLTSRLAKLRRELEELRRLRSLRRSKRYLEGMVHASIVGYASAGKTTLFNRLTGLSKRVGPEYFTTLQPKHYRVRLKGRDVVFIDTVGFIREVPPTIIEAFHSTLEEISDSDAIIFVVDASKPQGEIVEEVASGFEIMEQVGAVGIPTIIAANKVDLLDSETLRNKLGLLEGLASPRSEIACVLPISAYKGVNIDRLIDCVVEVAERGGALEALREGLRAAARPQT